MKDLCSHKSYNPSNPFNSSLKQLLKNILQTQVYIFDILYFQSMFMKIECQYVPLYSSNILKRNGNIRREKVLYKLILTQEQLFDIIYSIFTASGLVPDK